MKVIEVLLQLIFCHLVGDYVIQTRFVAESKGSNWYHLFVHCALYCLPLLGIWINMATSGDIYNTLHS